MVSEQLHGTGHRNLEKGGDLSKPMGPLGLEQARDCTEQIDTHASASERGPPVAE